MKQLKLYYPYPSDKPDKKYFVVVNDGESNTNKQLFNIKEKDKKTKDYVCADCKVWGNPDIGNSSRKHIYV